MPPTLYSLLFEQIFFCPLLYSIRYNFFIQKTILFLHKKAHPPLATFFRAKQEDMPFMTILQYIYTFLLSIFYKSLAKHFSGVRHYHKRTGVDFGHNVLNQDDLLLGYHAE